MNRWQKWAAASLALAALGAPALFSTSALAADPMKIRISWIAVPNNLPPLFMEKPDLMTRSGQSYTVDAVRFPDMQQSIAALLAGDLDIALISFSTFPLAVQNAKTNELRVIGDEFTDGAPDHYSAEFLVLKDGPIKDIKDLKGKNIALNVRGGAADMAMRAIAKKHGLEEKRDFTVTETAPGDMKKALLEKKADLVGLGSPWLSADPELRTATRTLFTQRDALGQSAQAIWVARKDFLEKNRAVMVDFMADAVRARRFYIDPKSHMEAVDIVSRVTKQPREQLDSWLFTKDDVYRAPDGVIDIAVLQRNIDRMVELGFLKTGIDVKKYQDLSIVKDATSRLENSN